jgi:hypothetical protein
MSLERAISRLVPCTSMTGDSPVTVTVSVTASTASSALTVAVNDPAQFHSGLLRASSL